MSERGGRGAGSELTGHSPEARHGPRRDDDVSIAEVLSRTRDQARDHWHEFSIIVAGANVLAGLVLAGDVAEVHPHLGVVSLVAAGITFASVMAAALAYYSIQVGALLIFGPLRPTQVLTSFLIAGAQLALFLWPAHVITSKEPDSSIQRDLRPWLLIFAAFAFFALVANWDAARVRRLEGAHTLSTGYENAQRQDRWATCIIGSVASLAFWLCFKVLTTGLVLGVISCAVASLLGIASQSRTVARLMKELHGAPIQDDGPQIAVGDDDGRQCDST